MKDDFKKAEEYYLKAIGVLSVRNTEREYFDYDYSVRICGALARIYCGTADYMRAFSWYGKVLTLYDNLSVAGFDEKTTRLITSAAIDAHVGCADIYNRQGVFHAALLFYKKAYYIRRELLPDPVCIIDTELREKIGRAYLSMEDYDNAQDWLEKENPNHGAIKPKRRFAFKMEREE